METIFDKKEHLFFTFCIFRFFRVPAAMRFL